VKSIIVVIKKSIVFLLLFSMGNLLHADPPRPPVGKRWVLNPAYSDEFNGTTLDDSKWYDHHPTWKGREPGIFLPSQVKVQDGFMTITGRKLDEEVVIESRGGKKRTFNIAGGAVVSKKTTAHYGYYECRFKASATSMSTTFWFSSRKQFPGPKGGDKYGQEWDVQECIGRSGDFQASTHAKFEKGMHSNSHYWYTPRPGETYERDNRASQVKFVDTPELASDNYNTYGGWLIDSKSASYYYNGSFIGSHEFYTELDPTPFENPMGMNMVMETYPFPWVQLPTDEELADATRNTCYYDWVRSYLLVDIDDPANSGGLEKGIQLYTERVGLDKKLTSMKSAKVIKIPLTYMANEDRDITISLIAPNGNLIASRRILVRAGLGHMEYDFKLETTPSVGKGTIIRANLHAIGDSSQRIDQEAISVSVECPNRGVGADKLEWVIKPTTIQGPFPYSVTEDTKNRELSAAMRRSFEQYSGIHPAENELYTQFKYTRHELDVFFFPRFE